jgi:putative ABC transport system permease protein
MNKLIIGNLVHRPLRSVISAFAVAIEVIMILSVVAIFNGIFNGASRCLNRFAQQQFSIG